jgi:glycosyltransferase involved in cell wall biosynthesis
LRLWLVKTGEPWPTDGQHVRLLRTGVMARQYARGGDDIIWFNEIFDHFSRHPVPARNDLGTAEPRLEIVGLNGRGYRRSVSLSRMLHHADVARDFRARAGSFARPDAIVAALTPLELCREAVRYGRNNGVPVVVDVRDLWPEVWIDLVPWGTRGLARAALAPYFAMLTEIVDGSSALCGISGDAVDWALSHGNRPCNAFDGALPLAYEPPELSDAELAEAARFWSSKGIERDENLLTICYFGNLNRRIELDTVLNAVRAAHADLRARVRIVFCGRGEAQSKVSDAAREFPMVHYAGWVNAAEIEALKRRSDIGLLPYPSTMDFTRSMPNKVFDYLSGGLPVLTCLKGVVAKLIAEEGCGWMYGNGDPESFLQMIGMLADNRARVAEAAASARRTGARFTASEIYSRFRVHLEKLCAAQAESFYNPISVT